VKRAISLIIILILLSLSVGCDDNKETVVIYTSVDRVYSEIIFKDFEKETGIRVLPVYDVEANKSVGLAKRLLLEKNKPHCDVFWNGEITNTIRLKNENILQPYQSIYKTTVNNNYIDKDNMWIAFGGRTRVFLINKDLLPKSEYPTSFIDIYQNNDNFTKGMANPVFGTSNTYAIGLYTLLGEEKGHGIFLDIANNNVKIVAGNSVVRDLVISGQITYGITDTDDAIIALNKSDNIDIVFMDQQENGIGTLVIPNSIALIKEGQNSKNGKAFIDYILKSETIQKMIDIGWIQINIKDNIYVDKTLLSFLHNRPLKVMDINYNDIQKQIDKVNKDMKDLFLQ